MPSLQAADFIAYELYLNYCRQKPWFQQEKSKVNPNEWIISNMFWNLNNNGVNTVLS
jgi:hypothetical protein